ncbi:hypothetical protein [Enterococcus faecium]|uniref:hypothetical protein n=1 Tax=Enterococcus faecium TaxID=1352 RepID=UPI00338D46B0
MEKINVGNNCSFGSNVYIDSSAAPISIGENTVIEDWVTIMPNVNLGKNVKVLSNSIVSTSFPDNVTIGGKPAKIL